MTNVIFKYNVIIKLVVRYYCLRSQNQLYFLRSYLQEKNYFLDTLNNLCNWFRFLTRYIYYSMYLKSQLSLINRTGGSTKNKIHLFEKKIQSKYSVRRRNSKE